MSLPCVNLVMKSLEYVCGKYGLNLEEVKSNLRKEEWWTQEYLCSGKLWCECVELSEKLSKSSSSSEGSLLEEGKLSGKSGKGGSGSGSNMVSVVLVGEKKISLPYNGNMVEMNCRCLKKNGGLYTQCENKKKIGCDYCSGCERNMKKKGESVPEFGRIEDRLKCDILDFVCRNGEKPVRYMDYLKKCKVTKEEVLESAARNNVDVDINEVHWLEEKSSVSSSDKVEVEGKGKGGSKGRPRKSKCAVEINKEEEDVIAKIVSDVCASDVSEICAEVVSSGEEKAVVEEKPVVKRGRGKKVSEEEVVEEKPVVKRGRAKKVSEEEVVEEKPVVKRGRAKKVSEEEVVEEKPVVKRGRAKKVSEEEVVSSVEEKPVVKRGRGKKVAAVSEEVSSVEGEKMVTRSKGKKVASAEEDEEVEEDAVCHIEYEGKKYLKSKNTGVVYDYNVFKKEGDVKVVGMWNDAEKKIEYASCELSEEEYDD